MSVKNEIFTVNIEANVIADWLTLWANPRGGEVKICSSLAHLWQEVYSLQFMDQARILICYNGEKSRGEFNNANTLHRVDRQWKVVVMRGNGFKNLTAEGIGQTGTPGSIDPFMDDVENVRDLIRVLSNITNEPPVDYKATTPMPPITPIGATGNVFVSGSQIEFSTANDLQAVVDIAPVEPS